MCDLQYGKVGEQALALVLPCLLEHGLPSRVEEVRNIRYVTAKSDLWMLLEHFLFIQGLIHKELGLVLTED